MLLFWSQLHLPELIFSSLYCYFQIAQTDSQQMPAQHSFCIIQHRDWDVVILLNVICERSICIRRISLEERRSLCVLYWETNPQGLILCVTLFFCTCTKLKAFTCLAIIPDCWLIMHMGRELGEGEKIGLKIYFFLGILDK